MARGKRIRKKRPEQKAQAGGDTGGDSIERFNGQLPPILPELQWPNELPYHVGEEALRRLELTNRAYSAAVYAHADNFAPRLESLLLGFTTKLFRSEKEELLRLFEQECFAVLGSLQEWLELMQPIPPAERIVLLKDYQAWMRQVKDLLREAVFAGEPEEWNRDLLHWAQNHKPGEPSAGEAFRYLIKKPVFFDLEYLDKFTELLFAQMELEQQLGLMSGTVLKAYEARIQAKRRVETKSNVEPTDTEQNILQALGNRHMTGPVLLKEAGYDYSSHYRGILSNLVKRAVLGNDHSGYFRR